MKRPYYIFSTGRIRRQQNTLFFEKALDDAQHEPEENEDDEILVDKDDFEAERNERDQVQKRVLPVEDIESIYSFGEMTLNTKLLNFLSQQHIPIHFFNYYGFYNGSYIPREYLLSGDVLVKQVSCYLDSSCRLAIAKEFLFGAVDNILKNLSYYQHRDKDLQVADANIRAMMMEMHKTKDINHLMTVEARIRAAYYQVWDDIIDADFEFKQRTRRPPENALNALISFGNSMLYTTVLGELYHTQLNPTVSFLHEPSDRRFSLSLDLAEVFKPFIVDRLIFHLLNRHIIKKEHFDEKLKFCYLNETGRKTFVQAYDERLKKTIKHRSLGRHVSYRRLIRLEAYKLIKHVAGIKPYKSFRIWW